MNEKRQIIGYNPETGEPIYKEISSINNSQSNVENNNQNINNIQNINHNQHNNQSNGKLLGFIIGILAFLIVAILTSVVILLLFKNKDSKPSNTHSNTNEYEENTNINNNTNTNNNSSDNSYIFKGFKFNKQNNYNYIEKDNYLLIYSNSISFTIDTFYGSMTNIKGLIDVTKNSFVESGYTVINSGIKSVSNNEIVFYDIDDETYKATIFFVESSKNDIAFEVVVMHKNNDISDSYIEEALKVVLDSSYTGNYSNYQSNIDIPKLNSISV